MNGVQVYPELLSFKLENPSVLDRPGSGSLVTLREKEFPNTGSYIPTEGILGWEGLFVYRSITDLAC